MFFLWDLFLSGTILPPNRMAFDLSLGRTSRVKSADGGGLSPLILGTFHLPEIHVTIGVFRPGIPRQFKIIIRIKLYLST